MADEDRIARVARALCVADGSDPEAMIEVGTDLVDDAGGERYHYVVAPAWTTYTGEARQMNADIEPRVLLGIPVVDAPSVSSVSTSPPLRPV